MFYKNFYKWVNLIGRFYDIFTRVNFVMWTSTVKVNIVYKLSGVTKLVLVFIYKNRKNSA